MSELVMGFTGTRNGMTVQQRHRFVELIDAKCHIVDKIHMIHGGAIGADEEADDLLISVMYERSRDLEITIYPSSEARWRYWRGLRYGFRHNVMPPGEPLVRNRKIVSLVTDLFATPAEMHEIVRSGTWATIRYGREADINRTIILPDGKVHVELNSEISRKLG